MEDVQVWEALPRGPGEGLLSLVGLEKRSEVAMAEPRELAQVLTRLAPERPVEVRSQAWREIVDWLRENHLERVLRSIRRRARGLDPLAVLHEFYLSFHQAPPRDVGRLRLEFRVLDAVRKVRGQDQGGFSQLPPGDLLPASGEGLPEQAATQNDCARELWDLVRSLEKPRLREVAQLRFVEGLELKEIAARLDIPLGTVKSDLNREIKPRFQGLVNRWTWQSARTQAGSRS